MCPVRRKPEGGGRGGRAVGHSHVPGPCPEPLIEALNLCVARDQTILKDIQWRVLPHERWVILGANGSGKTSLISSLAGHLPPTRGEVRVLGEAYGRSDWRNLRKRIGLVSPYIAERIHPNITSLELVLTGRAATIDLYHRPKPGERKEAGVLLQTMGCRHLEGRLWSTLSQGEQKRVLIARALMARYDVLFLDEPCTSLDPVAREDFLTRVARIVKAPNGPAVVLVTHHLEEIVPEFTHMLILKKGSVLAAGTIRELLVDSALSEAFGTRVRVERFSSGQYRLRIVSSQKDPGTRGHI